MGKNNGLLSPEDYMEPRCVLCEEPYGKAANVRPIPQSRVIEKMDAYMAKRDYEGAERHLLYWLEEAGLGRDERGELLIRNEQIGHYRKTGNREKALLCIEEALRLVSALSMDNTVSAGTTYTNAATALSAFGENERAMALFEKARAVYEANQGTDPALLGGLYNNMALVHVAMQQYKEAFLLYDKAMEQMEKTACGKAEQAITCLNMANAVEAESGMEKGEKRIFALMDRAYALLCDASVPHDGYYAFVCEKCAPTFSYYGYFSAANTLKKRSEEIYAGNGAF